MFVLFSERLTKKSYLKWDVARGYAMEAGIYDEKDVSTVQNIISLTKLLSMYDFNLYRSPG